MKKYLFPIDALVVWYPTWSKNLGRTLSSLFYPVRIAVQCTIQNCGRFLLIQEAPKLWHHWRSGVYIELHLPQYATVRMIHCKVRISGREPCKIWCTFAVQKLQLLCLLQMIYKNFLFSWKLSFTLHIKGSFQMLFWIDHSTVKLGNKELFSRPKIVSFCQKFLVLIK